MHFFLFGVNNAQPLTGHFVSMFLLYFLDCVCVCVLYTLKKFALSQLISLSKQSQSVTKPPPPPVMLRCDWTDICS